ncbi:hypothetical protein EYF80_039724 [Liparis tanakae]|uniref:Uncharacterized protein n=1 Tax=Liparis tanakae TaxID=230148 RepID=A0A4Z2G919_9TELE|nr:hypothetical protein EYF80_039724 [Liparis tanakae]
MNDTGLLQSSTHETRTHRGLWEHVTPHRHTCTVTVLPLTDPTYEHTQRHDVNLPCHGVSELLEERLVRAALLTPETTLKHHLDFGPGHGSTYLQLKYVFSGSGTTPAVAMPCRRRGGSRGRAERNESKRVANKDGPCREESCGRLRGEELFSMIAAQSSQLRAAIVSELDTPGRLQEPLAYRRFCQRGGAFLLAHHFTDSMEECPASPTLAATPSTTKQPQNK